MCASSVCGGVAGTAVAVTSKDVVDFNDVALVILSTIFFPVRSPVASAVFCSALSYIPDFSMSRNCFHT